MNMIRSLFILVVSLFICLDVIGYDSSTPAYSATASYKSGDEVYIVQPSGYKYYYLCLSDESNNSSGAPRKGSFYWKMTGTDYVNTDFKTNVNPVSIDGEKLNYAIIADSQTYTEWNKVISALYNKYKNIYNVAVFEFNDNIFEVQNLVKDFNPNYIAVVSEPNFVTSDFIEGTIKSQANVGTLGVRLDNRSYGVNQFNRSLSNAPYNQAILGVITGYTEDDAQNIATYNEPLNIKNYFGGQVPTYLDYVDSGIATSEYGPPDPIDITNNSAENVPTLYVKNSGSITPSRPYEDPIDDVISDLNNNSIDVVVTSGHGDPNQWQCYYYGNCTDRFYSKLVGGTYQLTGVNNLNQETPIVSQNPKIYLAIGDCLTAKIDLANEAGSYALSWLSKDSGDAYQYFGYTETTSFGMIGWGMADYFFRSLGCYSAAESVYAIDQATIFAEENNLASDSNGDLSERMDNDLDTTILYGDPAWQAKVAQNPNCDNSNSFYTYTIVKNSDGKWNIDITFNADNDFHPTDPTKFHPFFAIFPENIDPNLKPSDLSRIDKYKITNNFLLATFKGDDGSSTVKKGEKILITLE